MLTLFRMQTITAGEGPFDYHLNGLLSMLQLRGEEQFQTPRGRMLFRLVQLHLVRTTHTKMLATFTHVPIYSKADL